MIKILNNKEAEQFIYNLKYVWDEDIQTIDVLYGEYDLNIQLIINEHSIYVMNRKFLFKVFLTIFSMPFKQI